MSEIDLASRAAGTKWGLPYYDENPFLDELEIKPAKKRIANRETNLTIVRRNGEILDEEASLTTVKEVDTTQFIKLYVGMVDELAKLNSAGIKVFTILCKAMRKSPNIDQVVLSYAIVDAMDKAQLSEPTFRRGLANLVEAKVIGGSPVNQIFWINPRIIFNGDLLRFTQEYRLKKLETPATELPATDETC